MVYSAAPGLLVMWRRYPEVSVSVRNTKSVDPLRSGMGFLLPQVRHMLTANMSGAPGLVRDFSYINLE